MDIEIDRLNLQLSGDIAPGRAQRIGDLIGEALQAALLLRAPALSAAPAGYRVPAMALPTLQVRAEATDDEIAQMVANELARAMLREWETG